MNVIYVLLAVIWPIGLMWNVIFWINENKEPFPRVLYAFIWPIYWTVRLIYVLYKKVSNSSIISNYILINKVSKDYSNSKYNSLILNSSNYRIIDNWCQRHQPWEEYERLKRSNL